MANLPEVTFVNESISMNQSKSEILQSVQAMVPKLLAKQYPIHSGVQYRVSIKSEFAYGFTNLLFHVQPDLDNNPTQYLLRIYGESVVDRQRELRYVLHLQQHHIGPPIYGIFQNGRIEQFYADAKVVDPLRGYPKAPLIAKALADLHKVPAPKTDATQTDGEGIWDALESWYNTAKQFTLTDFQQNSIRFQKYQALNWQNIQRQIEWLRLLLPSKHELNATQNALKVMRHHYGQKVAHSLQTNKLDEVDVNMKYEFLARQFLYERVLSHNDVYVGNVLELQESGRVILIDFEYASYNYRAHDFATFFGRCERKAFRISDIPDAQQRRTFVEHYLLQFDRELTKKAKYSKFEWNLLLRKCDSVVLEFAMINAYIWGIWAVNQAVFATIPGVEYIDYAKCRLHDQYEYFKLLWTQQYKSNIICLPNAKL